MQIDFGSIESIIGLLFGGGGIGALLTWKFTKRKANAEAGSAEVDLAQKVQDTYQDMLEYKQKEVEDNHRLIDELRADRDHYKAGYEEMRDRQDKTEEKVRCLEEKVAKNASELDMMRPLTCSVFNCESRRVILSNDEDKSPKRKTTKKAAK